MTLKFGKLRWKNFISTGAVFSEIDLSKNSRTLVIGTNGSGKSTLLDALTFALYGKPFRKINKPQLVNTINQADCVVEIEFVMQGKEYKIRRGMKPNLFEIYEDGTIINQDSKSKDYQRFLENSILKMNYKAFTQIVVVGSSTYVPFMKLTPAERREFIEDILNISIFSKMNVVLKEKFSETKDALSTNTSKIEMVDVKITEKERFVAEISRDMDLLVGEKRLAIDEINEDLWKLKQKTDTIYVERENLIEDSLDNISFITEKLAKFGKFEDQLSRKKAKLNKEVSFYETNSNCPTCKQEISEEFKIGKVGEKKEKIAQIDVVKIKLTAQTDSTSLELKELQELKARCDSLTTQIDRNDTELKSGESNIKSLEKDIFNFENRNSGTVNDYEQELSSLRDEMIELKDTKDALVEDQYLYGIVAQLLRDDGIKTKIIKKYMPSINLHINKYLHSMDFFVQFELDENFNETLKSRHRDDFSYFSFSEGEKLRIDLALLFTWREIAKLKNMASTNILVFDEVFDSSLDASGTDEFIKILYNVEEGTNAFVISHKTEMLSDKFPEVLEFKKEGNFSEIVQLPE